MTATEASCSFMVKHPLTVGFVTRLVPNGGANELFLGMHYHVCCMLHKKDTMLLIAGSRLLLVVTKLAKRQIVQI